MSGEDLLARATRALRESTMPEDAIDPVRAGRHIAGDDEAAATTLERIEASTRRARRSAGRRRTVTRWLVMPLAASFVVFAAWASASGRLARWTTAPANHEHETPGRETIASAAPSSAVDAPPVTTSSVASTPEEPPAPPLPAPNPSMVPKATPRAADVDALYRDAHDAHFVKRDPTAALAAWDRYLAAAGPSARFALEARYNRAITLVRLGRKAEARSALRPFADGEYGGYRRDEAARLLGSLDEPH